MILLNLRCHVHGGINSVQGSSHLPAIEIASRSPFIRSLKRLWKRMRRGSVERLSSDSGSSAGSPKKFHCWISACRTLLFTSFTYQSRAFYRRGGRLIASTCWPGAMGTQGETLEFCLQSQLNLFLVDIWEQAPIPTSKASKES